MNNGGRENEKNRELREIGEEDDMYEFNNYKKVVITEFKT
jgi:hypothetical protein